MNTKQIGLAAQLEQSNLFYRSPAQYDQAQDDPEHTVTRLCELMIDSVGRPDTRTVLDFGCGTGRDLERLTRRFACIGVDLQPGMVDYARSVRPQLDVRLGDMRTFRLGREVDAMTCLGNSLAYLHDNADVREAFDTFAAHAGPQTLLILFTQVAPIHRGEPKTSRLDVGDLHANVTIEYNWNARTQINTMRRRWQHDDGREDGDLISRRVIYPRELELYLELAGFDLVQMFSDPTAVESALGGPCAYAVARFG